MVILVKTEIHLNDGFLSESEIKPLTLIGKSWKTHPETFLKFSFSGSSHRPFYWKTYPLKIMSTYSFFSILGRHIDRFTGKLIHSNFLTETIYDM